MSKTGMLYVFEGEDGAGKTTISKLFFNKLKENGVRAHLLGFPGNTPNTLGNLVYQLHHTPQKYSVDSLTPSSLQTMHIAAHLNKIEKKIIPILKSGETIVLDRFWWSTWVYGLVSGVPENLIEQLVAVERIAWNTWLPTQMFYITRKLPSTTVKKNSSNQLQTAYSRLVKLEKGKYPIQVIQNNTTIEAALRKVLACIL